MTARSTTNKSDISQASTTKADGVKRRASQNGLVTPHEGMKAKRATAASRRPTRKKLYCLCREVDDGTPMVLCSECKDWYHFRCVNLSRRDAEEIGIYVCPPCEEKTGRRTVMEWEEPEALEEAADHTRPDAQSEESDEQGAPEAPPSESDGDVTSDEYVDDEEPLIKGAKRRVRRLSISSESELEDGKSDVLSPPRRSVSHVSKDSASPHPSSHLKRKGSTSQQPQPKRKKSTAESPPSAEDPVRKYCLGKFEEFFCQIFLRHPYVPGVGDSEIVEKKPGELTGEEKDAIEAQAKAFASELEQCIFNTYSEVDKQGKPSAGAKYKDRFRMLSFNLPKPDRVALHKRISAGQLMPKDLSVMSSTDLANEELQQSIKQAQQEALEHSILQKATVPRAKITHKGLQDIEDIHGGDLASQREREQMDEERRERERLARIKANQAQAQAHQRSPSIGSAPPESPVTPQSATWGGPPSLPMHVGAEAVIPEASTSATFYPSRPQATALFVPSASDVNVNPLLENELNLADLINIDEEPSSADGVIAAEPAPTPCEEYPVANNAEAKEDEVAHSSPAKSTGISPFATNASQPEHTTRASFDLGSLWTSSEQNTSSESSTAPPPPEEHKATAMDDFIGGEADDQDFDMFLEKDDEHQGGPSVTQKPKEIVIEKLPPVWTGAISMPLDSTIPQEAPVLARQVGGRTLEPDSILWRTLCPTPQFRIDGRVPVETSSQYLVNMRMNSSKELFAVAFSPTADADKFHAMMNFLINKNRHGLVFPWGNRPKDYHPGRELYMIPLLSTHPLPDYLELMDELRFPPVRNEDYMVGIWILNKGKLAPLPTPTSVLPLALNTPLTTSVQSQPPPAMPNLSSISPANPLVSTTAQSLNSMPVPAVPQSMPQVISPAVAAEIASLTPEQIQLMLRTLSGAVPIAAPPMNVPAPPQPIPIQPTLSATPPQPRSWSAPFTPTYPHASPINPSPPRSLEKNSYRPGPSYDRFDREAHNRSNSWDSRGDREDRGWRDNGFRGRGRGRGGRGRERGSDRDRDRFSYRGPDSGWNARRARGGGP